jgi:hypothetical protein
MPMMSRHRHFREARRHRLQPIHQTAKLRKRPANSAGKKCNGSKV